MDMWDQQDGESAKAWAAFIVYRSMGPNRTLRAAAAAAAELSPSLNTWKGWANRGAWRARAAAWDAASDRQGMEDHTVDDRPQRKQDWGQVLDRARADSRTCPSVSRYRVRRGLPGMTRAATFCLPTPALLHLVVNVPARFQR